MSDTSSDGDSDGKGIESSKTWEEIFTQEAEIPMGMVSNLGCECVHFVEPNSVLNYFTNLLDLSLKIESINCILDNIAIGLNYFMSCIVELNSPERLLLCDLFYRVRHELLFKLFCLSLNVPEERSDVPFSDFGIDSKRTPDLILYAPDGTMEIFEISASSSMERMSQSKGVEEAGFESKYKKEMDEMNERGIQHKYHPILFDMGNLTNTSYIESFKSIKSGRINKTFIDFLEYLRYELCVITCSVKDYLTPMASMLFTKFEEIVAEHPSMEFMYEKSKNYPSQTQMYKEICVSVPVYNKINNVWPRLNQIIVRFCKPLLKYIIVISPSKSHRIEFKESNKGCEMSELLEGIENNDRYAILKYTYLDLGSRLQEALKSDGGVRFVERVDKNLSTNTKHEIPLKTNHYRELYMDSKINSDIQNCQNIINKYFEYNMKSVHYDPNYEDKFFKLKKSFDLKRMEKGVYNNDIGIGLLAENSILDLDIDTLTNNLKQKQIEKNDSTNYKIVFRKKSKTPFVLPLAKQNKSSYTALDYKNINFIKEVNKTIQSENPYTSIILDNILRDDFQLMNPKNAPSKLYNDSRREKSDISREITKLSREYSRTIGDTKQFSRLSDCSEGYFFDRFRELRNKERFWTKKINELQKSEGLKNITNFIRLPTKSKGSHLNMLYKTEMLHYKKEGIQSTISGVGIIDSIEQDYKKDSKIFYDLVQELLQNAGENPDLLIDLNVEKDCALLQELKEKCVSDYSNLVNFYKNSYLGHSSAFVSRLAHSLLYYSQATFSSDYIRVDNLGYKDTLLIIKGGKKIFKSKASKFFRIIYPVSSVLYQWYNSCPEKGSYTWLKIMGNEYILTPWQQMNESVLNDSISFYTRIMSFSILNTNPHKEIKSQFEKFAINIILSFHNRRQTEVLLANMRYILLATLGEYTGIQQIFEEFLGFNYDCFQSFIRNSILINYKDYFNTFKEIKQKTGTLHSFNFNDLKELNLKNIFTLYKMESEEDLALMIYSTFLMTKAPYQRLIERSKNLKGMIKIHQEFDASIGLKSTPKEVFDKTTVYMEDDYDSYVKKLFANDFNFDPEYCAQLGVFADSYFNERGLKEHFHTTWIRILNKNWDSLSTSTGLRGNVEKAESFWGQKGYFIVYKEIADDPAYISELEKLNDDNLSNDEKRKILRNLNKTYQDKLNPNSEFLIFHAVDKVQWRGNREIFVMDLKTKTMQQPIEQFMAEVCKKLDNELISIPSNKRAQVIHHSIFEKDLPLKDFITWYLTLDCSKWAPKSNFLKFLPTILSITSFPPTFKVHFLNYCEKLHKKRIYFNKGEVEVLKNNQQYIDVINEYLTYDTNVDGYYMLMPYSWVMGIFNYTSSFLHSINQKYSSYVMFKSTLLNFSEECTLVMFAHSDDSGGRISARDQNIMKMGLTHYEIDLKKCNHLLSKKKSVVSKMYFEILSVIYLFKKLLALLPKFLGGLRFLPTDKGPAQDMLQSYSKCIEVMIAGSDFSVAYMVMKLYSAMVYRFYNKENYKIDNQCYKIPVQLSGMPDAHPLMVLICGSDSDVVRLIHTEGQQYVKNMISFSNDFYKTIDDEGPLKPVKFAINVKGLSKDFVSSTEIFKNILNQWTIGNVNSRNTAFSFLSFLKKLNDPGFVGSLVNESTTRRISRAYYIRSGNSVITSYGMMKLEDANEINKIFSKIFLNDIVKNSDSKDEFNFKDIFPEKELQDMLDSINFKSEELTPTMNVYNHILSSPMRLCRYMDDLSLKNRIIKDTNRTLKPTHIDIIKSSTVFSAEFDPAQLVAYVKNPELSWSLPNLRNIFNANKELIILLDSMGWKIESISPDVLLKLCRMYNNKTSKDIYIYSRTPSELRQIKTYSSILTFLSTNSVYGKEIEGLTLDLGSTLVDPGYQPISLNPDIYTISTIIDLMETMAKICGFETLSNLVIKPIKEFGINDSCNLGDLISGLESWLMATNEAYLVLPQLNFIKKMLSEKSLNCELSLRELESGAFYTFLKSQKSRSGWYGSGELLIYINRNVFLFELYNQSIVSLKTNFEGKLDKTVTYYIMDTLNRNQVRISPVDMVKSSQITEAKVFGVDYSGVYSISDKREIEKGYPTTKIQRFGPLIGNMSLYNGVKVGPHCYLMATTPDIDIKKHKIYTLNIEKGEVILLMNKIFDKNSMVDLLGQLGIDNFEDFVSTEVLLHYGKSAYIQADELLDSFVSSKVYKILKFIKKENPSNFPDKIQQSMLPGNEKGLLRILAEYSELSGDKVIKVPQVLNPEIMSLRSEFPEQTTAIFSENLVKLHNDIYNEDERIEIIESYQNLTKEVESVSFRDNVIKLMRYWGYGSLVNTIDLFTLSRDDRNYSYFNLSQLKSKNIAIYSNLFIKLHKILMKSFYQFSHLYRSLDHPAPNLKSSTLLETLKSQTKSISATPNGFEGYFINHDIYHIQFVSLIQAFLKEPEFVNYLYNETKNDYILCSMDYSSNNWRDLVVLYNTLKCTYVLINKNRCEIDFCQKVPRLAKNVQPLNVSYKQLNSIEELNLRPSEVQYFGFANDDLISILSSKQRRTIDGIDYYIDQRVKGLSDTEVILTDLFKFEKPLNEDTLDSEDWEELTEELKMVDLDEDTIFEFWDKLKDDAYIEKSDVKRLPRKNECYEVKINFVLYPYCECKTSTANRIRQVGDNVVVLSNNYLPDAKLLPRCHYRLLNFSNFLKRETPDMIATVVSHEDLSMEFWDKILGGKIINIDKTISSLTHFNKVRNEKGQIITPGELGEKITEGTTMFKGKGKEKEKEETPEEEAQSIEAPDENEEDLQYKLKMEELSKKLLTAKKMGHINNKVYKRLKEKYLYSKPGEVLDIEYLFKNCMTEIELSNILNKISYGEIKLDKDDVTKIFQSPEHFGLARGSSKREFQNVKDMKLRAEIDTLHEGLSNKIASGTLTINGKFKTLMESNMKLWNRFNKTTQFKQENKKFLITMIISIINSATPAENDTTDDSIWQSIINTTTNYIVAEGPDSDEDAEFETVNTDFIGSSRLKYRAKG